MMRLLGSLTTFTLCGAAFAQPGPIPGTVPVAPAFLQADIVCNCITESLATQSEQTIGGNGKQLVRRHILATVRVQDIYKATEPVGTLLTVEYDDEVPSMSTSLPALSNGEVALLFLKRSGPSFYVFLDRFLGATRFTSIPMQQGQPGLAKLDAALDAVLAQGSRDDKISAMRLLEGFDRPRAATVTQLGLLSASADPEVALSAIATLLKANPASGAKSLDNYLATYAGDEQHVAFWSIAAELSQINDPKAEPSLESLASSKFMSIRFGAVDGMRRIRSADSAAALVQRLDDTNTDIRYQALLTLSEVFKKEGNYAPTMDLYDKNPDFYTNLWKAWWVQRGSR